MTAKELAHKTGISIRWARYILQGKRPSADLADRLEQATGVFAHVWLFPHKYKNELLEETAIPPSGPPSAAVVPGPRTETGA